MNQDFSELIEYLDEKFTRIDKELKDLKNAFNDLQTSVDAYIKKNRYLFSGNGNACS
ncbi:MAG: hypothetical protein LR000_01795 [Candidatus Pacebacteria bacterium]|nr:hypothetical protein [Candidatus Paceibacterota bacterium]